MRFDIVAWILLAAILCNYMQYKTVHFVNANQVLTYDPSSSCSKEHVGPSNKRSPGHEYRATYKLGAELPVSQFHLAYVRDCAVGFGTSLVRLADTRTDKNDDSTGSISGRIPAVGLFRCICEDS